MGWGTNIFHVLRSARGVVCWTGWVSLALMSPTCPQAHGDETARGSTFVLVRALLSFIGLKRLIAKLSSHDPEIVGRQRQTTQDINILIPRGNWRTAAVARSIGVDGLEFKPHLGVMGR